MPAHPLRSAAARAALALLAASVAGCASAPPGRPPPEPYAPVAIEHGRITHAEWTQRPSSAPAGAAFGGLLGLLFSGPSPGERVLGVAAGATAGGVLTAAAEGTTQGWVFTVELAAGRQVRVLTEQADLRVGDCVAVETGRYVNLRRVSGALCDGPAPAGWADRAQEDAARCEAAKEELLRAQGKEAVDAAVRKARVLCGT